MEWFFWMFAIWFAMGVMGRGACRLGRWDAYDRRRIRGARVGHRHPDRFTHIREASPALARPRPARRTPSKPKETPEQQIRRRFVEGRIDLDQYEAELWEELRPK